jgi:hypothetical protein
MPEYYGIVLDESKHGTAWLMRDGFATENPAKAWFGTCDEASLVIFLLNLSSAKPSPLASESL